MNMKVEQLERLSSLQREIRAHYSASQAAERVVVNAVDEMVSIRTTYQQAIETVRAETLLLGVKLREAKETLGYGNFIAWFQEQDFGFTIRSAQTYMRQAAPNTKGLSHLPARLCVKMVGMLKRTFGRLPDVKVILSWPSEDQLKAIEALRPAHERYLALAGAAANSVYSPPGKESFPATPSEAGEASGADFREK